MKKILAFSAIALAALLQCGLAARADDMDGLARVREAMVRSMTQTCTVNEKTVREFVEYSDHGSANDVLLLQLYTSVYLPEDEVTGLIEGFDLGSGMWRDLDYASQDRGKWQSTVHLTRLYALAKLYRAGESSFTGDERLRAIIHSGLAWWFEADPLNPNWWHNEIGVPRLMGSILLMMRDELSEEELAAGLRVVERSKFGMTGQNRTWLAINNLIRGLVVEDLSLVLQARNIIGEEICISEEEGIRDDMSFQQHGPQVQFGNYGLAYADGIALMLRILSGTPYHFSDEQVRIFSDYFRDGLSWCVYRGTFDPSFCGRQNFINAGRGKGCAFAVAARNMAVAMESEAAALREASGVAAALAERYAAEAELYAGIAEDLLEDTGVNRLVGARYFGRSDCGIYRTADWYSSVRMHSERTIGFEFTNRENTLANFSADGAVLLMQDGREYENIFACWDWRMVPGVTSYDDGRPIKSDDSREGKLNRSAHVGGAVAETSGGTVLAATMELSRDGLHALKSAVFFPDLVVELGADIGADNPDFRAVTTAVDQTRLVGEVVLDDGAVLSEGGSEESVTAEPGGGLAANVRWVHHDGRGYVSLDGGRMNVSEAVRRGNWDAIDPAYQDRWDEMPVFRCWIDHGDVLKGEVCGYAFGVLPCVSAEETEAFCRKVSEGGSESPVNVPLNTDGCQAVLHERVVVAVLHRAGRYDLGFTTVASDRPCILIRDLSTDTDSFEYLPELSR